jgi:hypothetical protein
MKITFTFRFDNGALDYTAVVKFSADVNASSKAADWLMNRFMKNWNRKLRTKIQSGVMGALKNPSVKPALLDEFKRLIFTFLGISKQSDVRDIRFSETEITVTFKRV